MNKQKYKKVLKNTSPDFLYFLFPVDAVKPEMQ